MVYETVAIVVLLLGCTAFLACLIGHLAGIVEIRIQELDQNLAKAIQNTVQNLPLGDMEPINPIQQVLAQFLMKKIEAEPVLVDRNPNGQFAKIIDDVTE